MIKKIVLASMLSGFFGLLLGANIAWGARCCGFVNESVSPYPPSFLSPGNLVTHKNQILCYNRLDPSLTLHREEHRHPGVLPTHHGNF